MNQPIVNRDPGDETDHRPSHELLIDRLYAGPGMRMVCSCGEWGALGIRPWSLEEIDAKVAHEAHANGTVSSLR